MVLKGKVVTVPNVNLLPFHWHKNPPTHEEHTSKSLNYGIYFRISEFREDKYDPFGTHEFEPLRRYGFEPSQGYTMVITLGTCWLHVVIFYN